MPGMWRDVTNEQRLSCAQVRELDRRATEELGIPSLILMENAGHGAAACLLEQFARPARQGVLVMCGPGNNGGDGLVIARLMDAAGVRVTVALAVPAERLRGDPAVHVQIVQRLGIPILDAAAPGALIAVKDAAAAAGLIVDALLGTGAGGEPRGVIADLIEIANAAAATRVAIDVPSGLDADRGEPTARCFRADATITLAAPKLGFDQPAARALLGRLFLADIGVTPLQLSRARPDRSGL